MKLSLDESIIDNDGVWLPKKDFGNLWGVSSKTENLNKAFGYERPVNGAVHCMYSLAECTSRAIKMRPCPFVESEENKRCERK